MVKRSNLLILDAIYLVCLVLISVISFTIFMDAFQTISFRINLVATYAAVTALWIYVRYVMKNMERFKRFVPGYAAVFIVLVIYLCCVICYTLFVGFADQGLRWFVLLHVVTAALAFIGCAVLLIFIRSTSQHEAIQQSSAADLNSIDKALKQLLFTMENHSESHLDKDRDSVKSIIELVKYSDPVTPASMQYTDRQILLDIELLNDELASMYSAGESVNKERLTKQIIRLKSHLEERNQQILNSKS